jgi:two-component system KDP operon response regulator KdpE
MAARILVVEDEPRLRRTLNANLRSAGFEVDLAEDGEQGLALLRARRPDVVLLDLMLPGLDGLEFLREIRPANSVPVIVLSARDEERQKVAALDLGADDYLTKPFGVDELLARIRVALRHGVNVQADESGVFADGALRVDFLRREVTVDGNPVHLTPTEFQLLKLLVQRRDRLVPQSALLAEAWGPEYAAETQYLRVYVPRLRRKLASSTDPGPRIETEPGVGYRFLTFAH